MTSAGTTRHALAATLTDDPAAIGAYVDAHEHVWPEVIEAGRSVGVLSTSIYRRDRHLFMVLVVSSKFDWTEYSSVLESSERVRSWQQLVDQYLVAVEGALDGTRWTPMVEVCHVV